MVNIPSPAVAIVGRHDSGKTTLIVRLIAELTAQGFDVGSIKHHSHVGIQFDVPGKDSYRHREAGATETVIASPGVVARVKSVEGETECSDLVASMPGHDIVLVEGYRKSGLPTIEIMRADNPADADVARVFLEGAREGLSLGSDFTQLARSTRDGRTSVSANAPDIAKPKDAIAKPEDDTAALRGSLGNVATKMPGESTVAVVTDIPEAKEAAALYGIPSFPLDDIAPLVAFLGERFVRQRITVVIQAGGESRRMGQSKALVEFQGRPLICRMVDRLGLVADELIITTNEAQRLEFLHEMYPDLGIRLVADVYPTRGALTGLYTAIHAANFQHVAIIACDMVFANPALVVAEGIAMAETGADVVVPVNVHGYEPFHAMYRRDTCLPVIERILGEGKKRAQDLFGVDDLNIVRFSREEVVRAVPMGGTFINVNTPEDLHRIEQMLLDE